MPSPSSSPTQKLEGTSAAPDPEIVGSLILGSDGAAQRQGCWRLETLSRAPLSVVVNFAFVVVRIIARRSRRCCCCALPPAPAVETWLLKPTLLLLPPVPAVASVDAADDADVAVDAVSVAVAAIDAAAAAVDAVVVAGAAANTDNSALAADDAAAAVDTVRADATVLYF